MTDVDRQLARSSEVIHRARERTAPKRSGASRAVRAIKYGVGGAGAVLLAAIVWGLVSPLGVAGIMITFLAMLGAMCLGVMLSREPDVSFETLGGTDLKMLPDRTARWLHSQRTMLPAPAQRLTDAIGVKLDQLAPQLQNLNEKELAAFEIRRLIGDELPELVRGYERVPQHLRRDGLDGLSPDKQLVEGLQVVDSELDRMCRQLASGDLKALATQGRYLELKYQDDPA